MNKKFLILTMLLAMAIALVGCTQKAAEPTDAPLPAAAETSVTQAVDVPIADTGSKSIDLTLAELAKFNGKDGKLAYIAVDGIIYDVSNVSPWKNGQHHGYEAGKDLTVEIKTKSPHGISKLSEAVKIGKLIIK